jgi:hypothetical protein
VAIGGNASDVIITTGDQNIVFSFKGADAEAVLTALRSIAPTRLHEVPRPPADFTGREDELKELLAAIETGAIRHAEQALTIFEQIEDPCAATVRAKLAAWRE